MNRRQFLGWSLLGGIGLLLPSRRAWPYSQSPTGIRKFIVALPGLGPDGIPVASPDTSRFPGTDFYRLQAGQFTQQLHPDLPPTRLWGFADVTFGQSPSFRYLGGVVVAHRNRPVRFRITNRLPVQHILPVDTTIPGGDLAQNRMTVHLHGGFTPWNSDGGPFSWFAPDGTHGPSFVNPGPHPGQADYYYPNQQSARMLWYHDHALALTRLNAYAGMASGYLLRDHREHRLIEAGIIPSREIPLVLQDKTFVDGSDPNYTFGQKGDLWYPYLYEPESQPKGRWPYGPEEDPPGAVTGPLPVPSVVPEMFGDTILANGTPYPFLEVERRRYRFRVLNGSQARFFNLQLYYADGDGGEANLDRPGPRMVQIGTEGGFLPEPVVLNDPPQQIGFDTNPTSPTFGNAIRYTLLLGPAERADLIIDFSCVPSGATLILYNDAPAPFPMGDPRNDYFTGDPDQSADGGAPTTKPGLGPNTRTLLQLRVRDCRGLPDAPCPRWEDDLECHPEIALPEHRHVRVRNLTLNEDFDELGRLIQRLGTNEIAGINTQGLPTFGRAYEDPATETPHARDVEIWRIFNLTGDTHPMHFHLVNVRILSRQPFDAENFNGTPLFTAPARPPDPNERGFKETVRMNPAECTTVIMKFDLPRVPFVVPPSPRTGGFEYVWHCHILEHEEHDMMRPLVVTP